MALNGRIDPEAARENLDPWLKAKLPGAEVSALEIPSGSGMSYQTVLFDASLPDGGSGRSERLVARVQPSGPAVHLLYDLEAEYRVMGALGKHTEVPVPRVRWFESDTSVLGAPFLVMDRVDGRVPSDDPPFTIEGWVLELSPDQRAMLCDNGLKTLANVHLADWEAMGLGFLDRSEYGARGVEQQLSYYRQFYEWAAEGRQSPTIDAAFEWLSGNRPSEEEPIVLSWGDARIGNMIFADDQSVAAVLDWEQATLAAPELDLAWWLIMVRHHTEAIGAPLPAGFPSAEQTIARYEELTGRAVEHLEFYEALAALRVSVMMLRVGSLLIGAGVIPPDNPMPINNPGSQILADILELPPPAGAVQSFLSH